jgi:tRNA threonylcarbamoyladenosine biosynthesis protein TsaB
MSYILNIETATKNCSIALAKNGVTILYKEMAEQGFSHAEKLHLFIEEIIKDADITFSDLSAVAVSQGPGSYTGLRIGVSAAKGLCYALEIPLISVDTLTVLANQLQIENGIIIPMIDARRMEVYSAIFNAKKEMIREVQAEILTDSSFSNIDDAVYFVGDSNEKAKTILSKSNFNFVDTIFYPSAQEMSAISYRKFIDNSFEDVAYFEPYYLKDFMLQTKST